MKRSVFVCLGVLALLASTVHGSQILPVAISPGGDRGVAVVTNICPTFSWTAVDWASGYRVAVFQAFGVQIPSYGEMAAGAAPVLSKEIPGRASSWTPSAEEALAASGLYVWYIQAADPSGQGAWSQGKLFMVDAGVAAGLSEERVAKTLREKGIREDVITDVVAEMKTASRGMIAGTADSKPQGKIGAQGTEGATNTFYGLDAGFSIAGGTYNTFIGRSAGYTNTTGDGNTFLGNSAGYTNSTGYDNTFLGFVAGYSNTTGYRNTILGYYAGSLSSTGNYNTFLGYYAGYTNTTAHYNTFLGSNSGRSNTTGHNNTFVGYLAGFTNTTGYYNTFLGNCAGRDNTTGLSNTFLGNRAGYANTSGSSNTFLGDYSGYTNSTGGSNVFVGYYAGHYETGSNKLYIANSNTSTPLIYGDFYNNIVGVNGWLGVGTQSPAYPMELKTTGRNSVLVVQRSDGGAMNFMNASLSYGQFGTGNGYPVRILVNSAWRMSLNLDNSLTMANGASCTAGGVWTNASSRELKENIENLSVAEAEEALAGLISVKYSYKADKNERHVGFIAEDVPDLVAARDRKSLSPMDITAVLTKVAQEQADRVRDLERVFLEQQKTISTLLSRIEGLERTVRNDK